MLRTSVAVAVLAAAVAAGRTASVHGAAVSTCRVPAHVIGWEAIFGYRSTYVGAVTLRRSAERVGFRHLTIEQIGCPRWAVALHGLRDARQARDFRAEAAKASFAVRIKCWPLADNDAYWEAIFGSRLTRRQAIRLRRRAAGVGFGGLKVLHEPCSNTWLVELDNIKTLSQAREFRAEARHAGFAVRLERRW